jgi:hypothetical protein
MRYANNSLRISRPGSAKCGSVRLQPHEPVTEPHDFRHCGGVADQGLKPHHYQTTYAALKAPLFHGSASVTVKQAFIVRQAFTAAASFRDFFRIRQINPYLALILSRIF